jgi:hypothetical protein
MNGFSHKFLRTDFLKQAMSTYKLPELDPDSVVVVKISDPTKRSGSELATLGEVGGRNSKI